MELFICRSVSDADSRFTVLDSCSNLLYTVTGSFGVLGDTLRIRDTSGMAIFRIFQSSALPLTVYSLSGGGKRLRIMYNHVSKKFTFMGSGWHVVGVSPVFSVKDADNSTVMLQELMPDGSRKLTVNYEDRLILCVAAAICINCLETPPAVSAQPT